jgi:hypothetical protein
MLCVCEKNWKNYSLFFLSLLCSKNPKSTSIFCGINDVASARDHGGGRVPRHAGSPCSRGVWHRRQLVNTIHFHPLAKISLSDERTRTLLVAASKYFFATTHNIIIITATFCFFQKLVVGNKRKRPRLQTIII